MMNAKHNISETTAKKYPSKGAVIAALIISAALSAIAAFLPFMIAAAALVAWVFSSVKHPAVTFAAPVLTFGLLFALTGSVYDALLSSLSVYIIGVTCGVCIKKKLPLWKTAAFCAVGFALYFGAAFFYVLYLGGYMAGGSVTSAVFAWWTTLTNSFADNFFAIIEAAKIPLETEITREMLSEVMLQSAALLPGTLSAVFVTLGAICYLSTYLLHVLFKTGGEAFPVKTAETKHIRHIKWYADVSPCVFFVISTLAAAVTVLFPGAEVVQFAFINICVGLLVPLLSTGIYTVVAKLRAPQIVVIGPDGKELPRAPRTLILWFIIPLVIFAPAMGLVFIAFYGASERINYKIAVILHERQQKKEQ